MSSARLLLAILVLCGAALAACSGNFGSGATPPGGLIPSGPLSGIAPTPSPTPNSTSGILTYGSSAAFQSMPTVEGYGGAIAFPVPSPRPSGFEDVPVGVTVAVVSPPDAPDLNLATAGKKPVKRERRARALVYISLLATRDITLASYPRIAVDVPRDIVTTFHEDEIQIALYNAGTKDTTYRLAVAEHDEASPPPTPVPRASAMPATPIPVVGSASAAPSGSASTGPAPAGALTPPPGALPGGPGVPGAPPVPGGSALPGASPGPSASPTLPPQRILFAATATTLRLAANTPAVFAVYAYPKPEATPSPSASGGRAPAPSGTGSPAATASGASAAATASATPGGDSAGASGSAPPASASASAGPSSPSSAAPAPSPS